MIDNIPQLSPSMRLRKNEPVGYHRQLSKVFEFNDDAYSIINLIDGKKTVKDIAIEHAHKDDLVVDDIISKCKVFINDCINQGILLWKT